MNKVLIPAPRNRNSFFEEIELFSLTTEYTYGSMESDIDGFDAVLIHWPEQLFKWKEPKAGDLKRLEQILKKWSERLRIFYVVHNLRPHRSNNSVYQELYDLVVRNSDVLIHFGHYSKEIFTQKYPDSINKVAPHPLYRSSMKVYKKELARRKLKIDSGVTVIIIPGGVRSFKERKLILTSFHALRKPSKLLIVPNMIRRNINQCKGYYSLKKIIPIEWIHDFFYYKKYSNKYRLDTGFVENEMLSLLMSAADIVFVPRLRNLNSGIVYLGLTFKKLIVGPDYGNSSEVLRRHDMQLFDPDNINDIKRALNDAGQRLSSFKFPHSDIAYLDGRKVAGEWDQLFN